MKFLNITLEFTWFAAAIACIMGAIKQFQVNDTHNCTIFCILAFVSVIMFYIRRARRISNRNKTE